jgi:periplasmic protein TonB
MSLESKFPEGVYYSRAKMNMPATENPASAAKVSVPKPDILPTLFGEGYGNYQIRPTNFLVSFVLHSVALALLIWSGYWVAAHRQEIKTQFTQVFVPTDSPYPLPAAPDKAGGGGGGGDRDKIQASKGALPKQSLDQQITPPVVVIRNETPKLPVEPTVVVPPSIVLSHNGAMGDPMSNILGPASNGTGSGGGIGSGSGGGVGSGHGPGVGPGYGGGIGGGYYRVGGGVSAPRVLFAPDPEYSEEARKAKYQGTVVLWVAIGPDGRPRDIRVQRSLGMGLDEKALEAVKTWRFDPATKDGRPVAVQINVEVNFRLY